MLKKILPIAVLLIAISFGAQAQIDFKYGSWQEIQAMATEQDKRIMVDAYTDWCTWCQVMDRNTFTDEEVAGFVNEHFVAWKLNMEEGFGVDMAMKYRVMSYPTILFFNNDGELVHKSMGYQDADEFLSEAKEAADSGVISPQINPGEFDPGYPDFYKLSFKKEKGEAREWPSPEQLQTYLADRNDLTDEVSWAVMTRFNMPEKYEEFFLSHRNEYSQKYGDDEVRRVVQKLVYDRLKVAMKQRDPQKLKEANLMVDAYLDEDKEFQKLTNKLLYHQRLGEWEQYMEAAESIMALDKKIEPGAINSMAWTVYKKTPGNKYAEVAAGWMEPVVEEHENYQYWDTYAALLFKADRFEDARDAANKAIRIGKDKDEDVSETQLLLEKIKSNL